MAFNGSFLWVVASNADQTQYAGTKRLKTINNVVYLSFDMHCLAVDGYDVTPNSREELKAYRDDNTRNLVRVTAQGTKTSMSLTTRDNMDDTAREAMIKWFTDHESNALQRKIALLYYDVDSCTYKSGTFYRADIPWKAKTVTEDNIFWNSTEISLIEY